MNPLTILICLNILCCFASNFPDQSLKDIRDIIVQSKPQTIKILSSLENQTFSVFSKRFLSLLTNSERLCPIIVQTFSSVKDLPFNDTTLNIGYEKVIVHILNDNTDRDLNKSVSVLHTKIKRKTMNRFVVIFEKITTNNTVWLENFFTKFEKRSILDIMIFYYDSDLKIYRYNPFLHKQQRILSVNQSTARMEYQNKYIIKDLNGHNFKAVFNLAGYTLIKDVDEANRTTYRGINIDMTRLLTER